MSRINRNMYKPPVSEKVKAILRQNFTNEIEFYNFCKQRLHMQYAALNLNKSVVVEAYIFES
jgi:dermatan/chondrotin sulfate uronyl 2-O-sulfotransferase UST